MLWLKGNAIVPAFEIESVSAPSPLGNAHRLIRRLYWNRPEVLVASSKRNAGCSRLSGVIAPGYKINGWCVPALTTLRPVLAICLSRLPTMSNGRIGNNCDRFHPEGFLQILFLNEKKVLTVFGVPD